MQKSILSLNRNRPLALLLLYFVLSLPNVIKSGNDFLTFYEIGKAYSKSLNIYSPSPSTGMYVFYLPFFASFMSVFSMLPIKLAASAWFLVKILCTVQIFIWTQRWTVNQDSLSNRHKPWMRWLFWLVILPFFHNDFRLGQVNIIVIFLLMASYHQYVKGKLFMSALLGALASFKIFPLLFPAFFLVRRDWKWLRMYVFNLLILLLLPIINYKLPTYLQLLQKLLEISLGSKISDSSFFQNQSLWGALSRLSPEYGKLWVIPIGVGIMVQYLWIYTRYSKKNGLNPLAAIFTAMMLLSPDTRSAHMVILTLPLYLLSHQIIKDHRHKTLLTTTLVIQMVLNSKDLLGEGIIQSLHNISLGTINLLAWHYLISRMTVNTPNSGRGWNAGPVPDIDS